MTYSTKTYICMGIIHSIVDMTDEKYDTTGVMWLESESESVRSRKFPARVHDVLRRLALKHYH
jgi:hypothetical protein